MVKTKDLSMELSYIYRYIYTNQYLLFYDDFGKIDDFLPNFRFSRVIYGFLKSWETDKLKKNIFLETDKLMKIMSNILKYASEYQIDAIFSIKVLEAFDQKLPNRTVL